VTRSRLARMCLPCVILIALGARMPSVSADDPPPPLPIPPTQSFPPQITSLQAVNEVGNLWTISGTVSTDGQYMTSVTMTGLPSVNATIPVAANGIFAQTFNLPDGEMGFVSVQAVDTAGRKSDIEFVAIYP